MTLLVLVGLKGAGKTHVGAVLEARLGVRFVRVEPIFLGLRNQVAAFTEVEQQIDRALAETAIVAIESTGTVPEHLRSLQQRYEPVRWIRVDASAETCLRRFRARDASGQIPISEERFREINARAARTSWRKAANGGDSRAAPRRCCSRTQAVVSQLRSANELD